MKLRVRVPAIVFVFPLLAACTVQPIAAPSAAQPAAPPTHAPDVYNQVPDTTVFEPGQCTAVLDAPVPAYTSNSLAHDSSAAIPPGEYEVGVAADYGSVLWLGLNNVEGPNYVNASEIAALNGDCATGNPLAGTAWEVTDYADPRNTTGMTNVLQETTLTANFGFDYSLGGSAGCNSFAGSYELRGDSLTIPGPLAATAMACAEDVMGQEQVYLTLLQQVADYTIDDLEPRLHLLNGKGQAIILLRPPNS